MRDLYIGLISGTSLDGIDAVIAEFGDHTCQIVAAQTYAYPPAIRARVAAIISTPTASLQDIGSLDVACGRFFADCALALIRNADLRSSDITAIGHHGQTIFHQPNEPEPFTLQIGDPSSVAAITGIDTVADIRSLDVALGGQGAPMVPAFHQWLFASPNEPRVIANIGGIANITVLVPDQPVTGFDTGPGNTLMDLWIHECHGQPFDDDGRWAASAQPLPGLLDSMQADGYFAAEPPKSTGREYFNLAWLRVHLQQLSPEPNAAEIQSTLAALTATTLTASLTASKHKDAKLIICGGGARNSHLLGLIDSMHPGEVTTTAVLGLEPDWVEATAFAWLARARLQNQPGNIPTVTGARQAAVLGGLYCG